MLRARTSKRNSLSSYAASYQAASRLGSGSRSQPQPQPASSTSEAPVKCRCYTSSSLHLPINKFQYPQPQVLFLQVACCHLLLKQTQNPLSAFQTILVFIIPKPLKKKFDLKIMLICCSVVLVFI